MSRGGRNAIDNDKKFSSLPPHYPFMHRSARKVPVAVMHCVEEH
jgi:hypothetical protein